MLATKNITDVELPPKTLCLTYDDGPGPDTAQIGEFLCRFGVRATFFVVGKFALEHRLVLDALHASGHLIGNHTFEHPDMPYYVSVGGDVRDQVIRTNTLIQKYNKGRATYLRATYGKWSPEVAEELNVDIRSSFRHVGPIYWDIDGVDCYLWGLGRSVEEVAQAYLEAIEKKGRGIVVMHDGIADMDTVAAKNQTLALTRLLVPRLQALGYRFVGLDEIEDSQLTSPLADTFSLQGPCGRYLRRSATAHSTLDCSGTNARDPGAQFVMELRGHGKVMLRSADFGWLRVNPEVDTTVRLSEESDIFTLFDLIPVDGGRLMLRSHNGNYLAGDAAAGNALLASARYMRQAWCWRYVPGTCAYLKPASLSKRIDHVRRRLMFIKSKLLHDR